jgi:hypothetical protein
MLVVLGSSPVAVAIARGLSASGPVVLAGPVAAVGPFLWRRCALSTGEGVAEAARGADEVVVVLQGTDDGAGALSALKPSLVARATLVLPSHAEPPQGWRRFPEGNVLKLGPVWGPEVPLVQAWVGALLRGEALWLADPGAVRAIAEADVLAAVEALAERRGARWVLTGERLVRLPELADALAQGLGRSLRARRVPMLLASRQAGWDAATWRAWEAASVLAGSDTDDWRPTRAGAAGWLGPRSRWEAVEQAADGA